MGESAGSSPQKRSPRFQPRHEAPAALETARVELEEGAQVPRGKGEANLIRNRLQVAELDHNTKAPKVHRNKPESSIPTVLLGRHCHNLPWV